MHEVDPYIPKNKIRMVTAASLFDGHDASINIMRRIIQATGVEVIHLGHDRSVEEVVNTAIQEDVHAIALTSYQGGHLEYFKYMFDLLQEKGASHIKIFGGGGGVILEEEIKELMDYGITRIYAPDDGRKMGLQGMINDMVAQCDHSIIQDFSEKRENLTSLLQKKDVNTIAGLISLAENDTKAFNTIFKDPSPNSKTPVLGITGTGGAGKSSLVDELVRRFLFDFPHKTLAIVSVDPSKRKTGGALLGDRIRMNAIHTPQVYMRSLATRQSNLALSKHVHDALQILKTAQYDLIILETSGIGQSDTEIVDHSDVTLYVMTPEYGAATQLEKIDMLDFADLIAINKFDKRGADDALRDVKKQYQRNHKLFEKDFNEMPVFGTMASQFNDPATNDLYVSILNVLNEKEHQNFVSKLVHDQIKHTTNYIIPPKRVRYLSEIVENNKKYDTFSLAQKDTAQKLFGIFQTIYTITGLNDVKLLNEKGLNHKLILSHTDAKDTEIVTSLLDLFDKTMVELHKANWKQITEWENLKKTYKKEFYTFEVRNKTIEISNFSKSLSHTKIPKIALPKYSAWGDIIFWTMQENVPGHFPYTAGIYPLKRTEEDPTRMFAGEGGPERTNRRFHYVSLGMPAKRLSTAFDSVTLYGNDPDVRPDIYGKIGNSGVSICCLDDAKKLYSGFDLTDPKTSVSMTINGPAPMMLGYFLNAVIDQECEKYIFKNNLEKEVSKKIEGIYTKKNIERPHYQGDLPEGNNGLGLFLLGVTGDQVLPADVYQSIKKEAISKVRGTIQSDILKEDQAQNTCIFSTEFALRLMGDVQEYFIENNIRNFYSVSISGYHIAEAGANPISQLAFTLANGFTYVEYYLSRGMKIDDFAPNLSFFFSNGIDPEYAVIGRVARKIWSKAIRDKYHGNERSQMLKYHIQTSGRSLACTRNRLQ